MRKDIAKKWCAALRSGEYQQGYHALCTVDKNEGEDNKYCCLGVLACLSGQEFDGKDGFLPLRITEWANLSNVTTLIRMNDNENKSFSEIADFIEQNYTSL